MLPLWIMLPLDNPKNQKTVEYLVF